MDIVPGKDGDPEHGVKHESPDPGGDSHSVTGHMDADENVTELLERAADVYEFRVKYYQELMRETVNDFEGGLKRAHVDELTVLIDEASEETKEMQKVCHKIVKSLSQLIPVIYQSIEILEFQVKADTG